MLISVHCYNSDFGVWNLWNQWKLIVIYRNLSLLLVGWEVGWGSDNHTLSDTQREITSTFSTRPANHKLYSSFRQSVKCVSEKYQMSSTPQPITIMRWMYVFLPIAWGKIIILFLLQKHTFYVLCILYVVQQAYYLVQKKL